MCGPAGHLQPPGFTVVCKRSGDQETSSNAGYIARGLCYTPPPMASVGRVGEGFYQKCPPLTLPVLATTGKAEDEAPCNGMGLARHPTIARIHRKQGALRPPSPFEGKWQRNLATEPALQMLPTLEKAKSTNFKIGTWAKRLLTADLNPGFG